MTQATPFDDAFGTIGQAVQKLRRTEIPSGTDFEVTVNSPDDEMSVTIGDAKIRALSIRPGWFETALASDVARLVTETVNRGIEEWSRESLSRLRTATPDLAELSEMVDTARRQIRESYDNELRRAREL